MLATKKNLAVSDIAVSIDREVVPSIARPCAWFQYLCLHSVIGSSESYPQRNVRDTAHQAPITHMGGVSLLLSNSKAASPGRAKEHRDR